MRHLLAISLFLSVSTVSTPAWSGDDWTLRDPNEYFLHVGFDWTAPTLEGLDGNPIATPFVAMNHFGVNLANLPKDEYGYVLSPTRGWRLYHKRMTCEDYNTEPECADQFWPYFVLYNIHIGTLRLFLYVTPEAGTNDYNQFLLRSSVQDIKRGPISPVGLRLNEGPLISTLARKGIDRFEKNEDFLTVTEGFLGVWVVIDYELSYDPAPIPDSVSFRIKLQGGKKSELTQEGVIEYRIGDLEDPETSMSGADLLRRLEPLGKAIFENVSFESRDAAQVKEQLKSSAEKLKTSTSPEFVELGNALENASKLIDSDDEGLSINWASLAIAAGKAIAGFFEKPDKASVQYANGTVRLAGTFNFESDIRFLVFGVHNSAHEEIQEQSDFEFDGHLGLFSFALRPRIEVGDDYLTIRDNIRSLIVVNPDSDMRLVDVKIRPIFAKPSTQQPEIVSVGSTLPATSDCKKNPKSEGSWWTEVPEFHSWPVGRDDYVMYGYDEQSFFPDAWQKCLGYYVAWQWLDPQSDEMNIAWNPRDGFYREFSSETLSMLDNSTVADASFLVLMEFRHESPQKRDDIYVKRMITIPADITQTRCSKSEAREEDSRWHSIFPIPDGYSELRPLAYHHRPCELQSGNALLYRYPNFSGATEKLVFQPLTIITRSDQNHLHFRSLQEVADISAVSPTFTERPLDGPTVTAINGELFLVTSSELTERVAIYRSVDGFNFRSQHMNRKFISRYAPSLAWFGGRYYLAWTDALDYINVASSADGAGWDEPYRFDQQPLISRGRDGPLLFSTGDRLLLGFPGKNGSVLRFRVTEDGTNWYKEDLADEKARYTPTIARYGDSFYLAWAETGDNKWINIMSSEDGRNWGNKVRFNEAPMKSRGQNAPTFVHREDGLFLYFPGSVGPGLRGLVTNDGVNWQRSDIDRFQTDDSVGAAQHAGFTHLAYNFQGFFGTSRLAIVSRTVGTEWPLQPRWFFEDPKVPNWETLSSIRVGKDTAVIVYSEPDFAGDALIVSRDTADLGEWSNRVRSLRIQRDYSWSVPLLH